MSTSAPPASGGSGNASEPADLIHGPFTNEPPWLIDPEQLEWKVGLSTVRELVRRQVPELIKPRRIPDPGRLAVVARHLGLGIAWWWAGARRRGGEHSRADLSRRLRIAGEAPVSYTHLTLPTICSV